jgi:hypothetical protein
VVKALTATAALSALAVFRLRAASSSTAIQGATPALEAFLRAALLHPSRRIFALVTEGLWAGYSQVRAAREFMRATLYQSRYAARNLLRLQQRIDPNKVLVGMHVRLGDFAAPVKLADCRRSPNTSLPIEWFENITDHLQQAFADDWQLLLVSDGTPEELQPLLSRWRAICTNTRKAATRCMAIPSHHRRRCGFEARFHLDAAVQRRNCRRWELDLVRGGVAPMPVNAESQLRRLSR